MDHFLSYAVKVRARVRPFVGPADDERCEGEQHAGVATSRRPAARTRVRRPKPVDRYAGGTTDTRHGASSAATTAARREVHGTGPSRSAPISTPLR
jgi:hypothetical protein